MSSRSRPLRTESTEARATKPPDALLLVHCCCYTLYNFFLLEIYFSAVQLPNCSCMHTGIGEVATGEQMCSGGSCAGDFWCWWPHSWWSRWWSGVNSASGFLRKPLDLLHPHQSVMLVSVSQFHHFYLIP